MKKKSAKWAALLLAACMVLALAACGKKGGESQQRSGTVYVPQFMDCALEDVQYVNQGCSDGQYIYFSADIRGEEKEETWTDPETGETEVFTYYDSITTLFRVDLSNGNAAQLENYQPPQPGSGDDGSAYLSGIQAGEDGALWVTEEMTVYQYDLPEDFDGESGDKWEYQTGYEETMIRRQLDSSGKELSRTEISSTVLQEKLGVEYVNNIAFDAAGNLFVILSPWIIRSPCWTRT